MGIRHGFGLWLLANEYWLSAVLILVFAKFLGVGVAAFIFDVTRPKLLQMAWFQKLYDWVMAMRAKARASPVRPSYGMSSLLAFFPELVNSTFSLEIPPTCN